MNMTLAGVEVGYPERTILPDELVPWDVSIPPGMKYGTVEDKLVVKGIEIPSSKTQGTIGDKLKRKGVILPPGANLATLARASNSEIDQRYSDYDEDFVKNYLDLRSPFGRTGLNGVGIFYEAGASKTSDAVVLYRGDEGLETLLVHNRNRFNTPGVFQLSNDRSEKDAAFRGVAEETGIDLNNDLTLVLREDKTSVRTTDLAWISASVYTAMVDLKHKPVPGEREDNVFWVPVSKLPFLVNMGELSKSKLGYINQSLKKLGLVQVY